MPAADYDQSQSSFVEQRSKLGPWPPNFDERAVATAQPVEPLPSSSSNWKRKALIGAGSLAYLTLVAITLFVMASSPRPTAVETQPLDVPVPTADVQAVGSPKEVPTANIQAVASPEKTQSIAPADSQTSRLTHAETKVESRHVNSHPVRTVAIEEHGKPMARRVGVILYGRARSTDQP